MLVSIPTCNSVIAPSFERVSVTKDPELVLHYASVRPFVNGPKMPIVIATSNHIVAM